MIVKVNRSPSPLRTRSGFLGKVFHCSPRVAVALIVVMSLVGWVGTAFTAPLIARFPWLLPVLSPGDQSLLLSTAAGTPLLLLVPLVTFRLFVADPLWFSLGCSLGDRATGWLREGARRFVLAVERGFERNATIAVFFFPGMVTAVLAGATGMSVRRFVTANIIGTAVKVIGVGVLAVRFAEQARIVNVLLVKFQWPSVAVLTLVVLIPALRMWRSQRRRTMTDTVLVPVMELERAA